MNGIALPETLKERAFPPAVLYQKRELRRSMRQRRSQCDPRAARVKNRRIAEQTISLPEILESQSIAIYASLPDEVQTDTIASSILLAGKTLVYPCVEGKELQFRRVRNPDIDLSQSGSFGIREPDRARCERIPLESIDLFIMPGVAFDLFGGRVGYGGGYYDRVLGKARRDSCALALAFEYQVVRAIQTGEFDRSAQTIVTDEWIYNPTVSKYVCPTEEDTRAWAMRLIQNGLGDTHIVALHADLGVGKTVFTQGLARALRTGSDVISPTFIYCREYESAVPLIHVDAYRLEEMPEGDEPFWDEILERPGIRVIEWAERLGARLPKTAIHIFGQIREDHSREWTLFTPLRSQIHLHEE